VEQPSEGSSTADAATPEYLLGTSASELRRLDAQSGTIAMPTAWFMRRAGISAGMRVLDLGTGLGDVAFQLSELVGSSGSVVAIDEAPGMLAVAERRRLTAGIQNLRFLEADAGAFRDREPFDAVVGRLIWCYLPDPLAVVRHHAAGLGDGGLMLLIDQDTGSVRTEPPVALVDTLVNWAIEAHTRAGTFPAIGSQLGLLLRDAGLTDVETFGIQSYLAPDDPAGPALLSGIVRTVAPSIVASGLATEDELALDSLERRVSQALRSSRAVFLLPTVAGAWGRRRSGS